MSAPVEPCASCSGLAERVAVLEAKLAKLAPPASVHRLGIKALMARLGIKAESTVWRWVESGYLPPPEYLGGRLRVWRLDVIERWEVERAATAHVKVRRGVACNGRARGHHA